MRYLELLAPARNLDIGIAAIDCGADAVYIAGPSFGARKAAGNSIEDIRILCGYAHRFGVRIFVTVNTIIYEEELSDVHSMMLSLQEAGVDAFIVQDLAISGWKDITVPLHASTQCSIRTAERASELEKLGFARLVLERELSIDEIKSIRKATGCELEAFVHGAMCVCYSGQCYMSEHIEGRSANRGDCMQACRSLYDLVDSKGKTLIKGKALLSLKDLNLLSRLEDLAAVGVSSFKIEGRLKNISYVRNTVRAYSKALDAIVKAQPDKYARSSFGTVSGGFEPSLDKTFNRGYTPFFLDGKRGAWSSMDTPKSMGELIGKIRSIRPLDRNNVQITVQSRATLSNGDGFCAVGKRGIIGFRGDVCEGNTIRCKTIEGIREGDLIYRNISVAFEKELETKLCRREIPVTLTVAVHGKFTMDITATTCDGRSLICPFNCDVDTAENRERQEAMIREQLSKRCEEYCFKVSEFSSDGPLPLLGAATLNGIRRCISSDLSSMDCKSIPLGSGMPDPETVFKREFSYKDNVANSEAKAILASHGATVIGEAYELQHKPNAELMRTRYCIRHELGICLKEGGCNDSLFLVNNGKRYALGFDCRNCEMTVSEG